MSFAMQEPPQRRSSIKPTIRRVARVEPTEAPVRSSRTSEAVAGGTPCDDSPVGPKTGRGHEIGDHLL